MNRSFFSLLGSCLLSIAAFAQTTVGTITLGPPPATDGISQMVLNPATNKAYLFCGNLVKVVDLTINRIATTIALPLPPSSASPGFENGAWVNAAKNQIFTFRGNQFVVIDGVTDSVQQTFSLPALINGTYSPISYSAGNNKFYIGETKTTAPFNGEVRVVDAASFATTAIIPAPSFAADVPNERPAQILINPGNSRVYVLYQTTGSQILDLNTNAILANASCDTSGCNSLTFPPGNVAAMISPRDNSVWVALPGIVPGPTGGEDGASGFPGPTFTIFWRIDPATNAVVKQFMIFGQETELLGIDPNTGFFYMMAANLPTAVNQTATTPVISAFETMLVVLDPNNVTPTDANPSPMRRISVNGTLLANTGTPFTCGAGVQAFEPIGVDLSAGYIYWRCDATIKTFSSIVVSRTSFTDLGIVDDSQFVSQLQTTAGGQISGHAIPVGVSADYAFGGNITPNHNSVFFSAGDNQFFTVNPATPSVTTIPLGALPAGIAIDTASHRGFVTDLTSRVLSVVDLNSMSLVTKTPGPGGALIAGNGAGQFVLAGPTDPAADAAQTNGAFLFDEPSTSITQSLAASASSAIAVNPVTNTGYFADANQWFAVDLNSGSRLFAVTDLTAAGTDTCAMTGISVSKTSNHIFAAGHCTAGGNTLAVFDGNTRALLTTSNVDAFMQTIGRILVNPNTSNVYVEAYTPGPLSFMGHSIEVFDGNTFAHLNSMTDRTGPMAVNTVTNLVYAANTAAGVSAIDGLAPEQQSTFAPLSQVSAIAVDEIANNILVTSYIDYLGSCCTPTQLVYQAASGTVQIYHQDPATYLLQGLVTSASVPQTGITITVAGANGGFTQVTGANGIFAARLVPGTYTVTPSSPAFTFLPASATITLGQIDQTVATFVATPIFHITGTVLTQAGAPVAGVTINATPAPGSATALTDASGQYSLPALPAGTYTVSPVSPANFYSPASQSVQIRNGDTVAPQFTVNPSLQITGFTLSSSLLGAGVQGSGTVTINEVAPKGGISVALSSSDTKTVKPPTTFTIPAGASSGTFTFTGSGTATVTLTATYSGTLAVTPVSATARVSIVGVDSVRIGSATWSTSAQTLKVTATSTNPSATLTVTLASNGQNLGTMSSQGNGTFTLQTQVMTKPSSINVKSSLGGSSGQGVSVVP